MSCLYRKIVFLHCNLIDNSESIHLYLCVIVKE